MPLSSRLFVPAPLLAAISVPVTVTVELDPLHDEPAGYRVGASWFPFCDFGKRDADLCASRLNARHRAQLARLNRPLALTQGASNIPGNLEGVEIGTLVALSTWESDGGR